MQRDGPHLWVRLGGCLDLLCIAVTGAGSSWHRPMLKAAQRSTVCADGAASEASGAFSVSAHPYECMGAPKWRTRGSVIAAVPTSISPRMR